MDTNQLTVVMPADVEKIAQSVSIEKRTEVQSVLNHVFNGVAKMREQLETVTVADENDRVNMKLANTIRLGVRQVRLDAEKTFDAKRAEVQQQMMSFKTEDALWLKAKQTMQILTKEIEENARWKEETRQRFEAEQKELKIQQRMVEVAMFAPEIARSEFELMSDETFTRFLSGIEKSYNERVEAERKAEVERIEREIIEVEERERQRIENERLKAEAAERERQIEAERKEAERKRREIEEKARIELEKAEAEQKRLREEFDKKQSAEAAERKKLEDELRKKREAEEKEKAAKIKADKDAAAAPDREKLKSWINTLQPCNIELATNEGKAVVAEFNAKVESFKNWCLAMIEKNFNN